MPAGGSRSTLMIQTGGESAMQDFEHDSHQTDVFLKDFAHEMELNDQLARVNSELERFQGCEHKMRISKNQFNTSDKDPIFFLNGPYRKKTKTDACVSCNDFIFEKES
mmetsp:Transcript_17369/g.20587  ORF Transcript_17369/g.20587 Transcript_17369/m.20587 type:complete len:108 (+) Transcript_17369:175-498(+)